jgi:hypothetical protein
MRILFFPCCPVKYLLSVYGLRVVSGFAANHPQKPKLLNVISNEVGNLNLELYYFPAILQEQLHPLLFPFV